ncbi:MAG: YbaB/EbfC family nucleoid-associated protein [Propionibacteriaceae bacterium]|nr:YbaB/EbfC family nucleoid-associated protein [Propionibacteriaceae bacterium]
MDPIQEATDRALAMIDAIVADAQQRADDAVRAQARLAAMEEWGASRGGVRVRVDWQGVPQEIRIEDPSVLGSSSGLTKDLVHAQRDARRKLADRLRILLADGESSPALVAMTQPIVSSIDASEAAAPTMW